MRASRSCWRRSRRTTSAVALAALLAAVPAQAAEPVLGSPDYAPHGHGFGTARPAAIFNGGVPSGSVTRIRWTGWGGAVAGARATGNIYRPQGGYYPPVGIRLRARDLGTCPGHPETAYTTLQFREPQWPGGPLGPWLKWSGTKTICRFGRFGPRPAGVCRPVGGFGPGSVFSIEAYRMGCARARSAARALARRGCPRSGCTARVAGLRCRLSPLHANEYAPASSDRAQRMACRRGAANFSGFLVR